MSELHAHMCGLDNQTDVFNPDNGCGHVWAHDGNESRKLSGPEYRRAHTCPACGRGNWRLRLPPDFRYEDRDKAREAVYAFGERLLAEKMLKGRHGHSFTEALAIRMKPEEFEEIRAIMEAHPSPADAPRDKVARVLELLTKVSPEVARRVSDKVLDKHFV